MKTTKEKIKAWLKRGNKNGNTHMEEGFMDEIKYKCNECDGKWSDYCEIILKGAVCRFTDPSDEDFPDCPYKNTDPIWRIV